jgi:hypothetical protein
VKRASWTPERKMRRVIMAMNVERDGWETI